MKDILRLARCNESDLNSFLQTLNDYTLVFTKDTHNLYTKINGNRIFIGAGSALLNIDQPILKDFRVFADNRNNVPLQAGRFYGFAGNADKTYRMTYANIYDGEMLGILESTVPNDNKYILDLMTNLNVFTESEEGIKLWDPVYIGKYRGNIISVTDKTQLETVYGIGGVVTEVTENKKVGRFTYNAFLLQATYFTNSIVDMDVVRALITAMLADYVEHDEFDDEVTNIHRAIQDGLASLGARITANTESIALLDGKFENYYNKNEVNVKLAEKADVSSVYNRVEMDAKLLKKADVADTYTKQEVNQILETAGDKVLSNASGWIEYNQQLHKYIIEPTPDQFVSFVDNANSDVEVRVSNDGTRITMDATKLGVTLDQVKEEIKKEMDPQLALKADKATTYTKDEIDAAVSAIPVSEKFTDLADTPNDYSPGRILAYNMAGDGITSLDPFNHLTALDDTPSSYIGQKRKALVVKEDESGTEFASLPDLGPINTDIANLENEIIRLDNEQYIQDQAAEVVEAKVDLLEDWKTKLEGVDPTAKLDSRIVQKPTEVKEGDFTAAEINLKDVVIIRGTAARTITMPEVVAATLVSPTSTQTRVGREIKISNYSSQQLTINASASQKFIKWDGSNVATHLVPAGKTVTLNAIYWNGTSAGLAWAVTRDDYTSGGSGSSSTADAWIAKVESGDSSAKVNSNNIFGSMQIKDGNLTAAELSTCSAGYIIGSTSRTATLPTVVDVNVSSIGEGEARFGKQIKIANMSTKNLTVNVRDSGRIYTSGTSYSTSITLAAGKYADFHAVWWPGGGYNRFCWVKCGGN